MRFQGSGRTYTKMNEGQYLVKDIKKYNSSRGKLVVLKIVNLISNDTFRIQLLASEFVDIPNLLINDTQLYAHLKRKIRFSEVELYYWGKWGHIVFDIKWNKDVDDEFVDR